MPFLKNSTSSKKILIYVLNDPKNFSFLFLHMNIKNKENFTLVSNLWKYSPKLFVIKCYGTHFSQQFQNQRKILRCFPDSVPDHFAADLHKKLFFGSKFVSKETVADPDPADADLCGFSFATCFPVM